MIKQQIFCKNCILPNNFLGITLSPDGICNFCHNPAYNNENWSKVQIDNELRKNSLDDWKLALEKMKQNQKQQQYDCVIGYSGGKDSTALLYKFIYEYKIRPLAITIDTGFMTDVAKQNIRKTLKKIEMINNHILIESAVDTFTKLYKWHFFNHSSNHRSLTVDICDHCSNLIHSIVVKEAIKRNINTVIFGYSPDQIKRYFYEIPRKEALYDWMPDLAFKDPFNDADRKWYINSEKISLKDIPRIILPYHVLDYNEKKIIELVESKELIEVGKADPVLTNCHVVKAALMFDLYRYGGLTYALQYAELVRQQENNQDRKKSRKNWLRLYKNIAQSILNGTFNKDGMKKFYDNIGISKEELLISIIEQRKKDPNAEKISRNIELIKIGKIK